jgi:hypothetical protein
MAVKVYHAKKTLQLPDVLVGGGGGTIFILAAWSASGANPVTKILWPRNSKLEQQKHIFPSKWRVHWQPKRQQICPSVEGAFHCLAIQLRNHSCMETYPQDQRKYNVALVPSTVVTPTGCTLCTVHCFSVHSVTTVEGVSATATTALHSLLRYIRRLIYLSTVLYTYISVTIGGRCTRHTTR